MKKATKKEIETIRERFLARYGEAATELTYANLYELLIAVMLSAQCTDKRVNIITPSLFKKYPDIYALSKADIDTLKALIGTCSFYNNKAKNMLKTAQKIVEEYNGEIPTDAKELVKLDGVGQKTANVVMIEFTGANLMAVDTHVYRVAHRLGLSDDTTALKTEATLTRKFKTDLHALHQAMVLFGRYICTAKNPKCESECFLQDICKSKTSFKAR